MGQVTENGRRVVRGYADLVGAPGKYPALDGLRALAILMVLLRHWGVACREQYPDLYMWLDSWPMRLALGGWSGVDLFFVLSGFLVGSHLLQRMPAQLQRGFFGHYVWRRALRILPLYLVIILLSLSGLLPIFDGALDAFQLVVFALFLQDYFGAAGLVPLWSLGVEEKFYLLAPLVLARVRHWPVGRACATLLIVATLPLLGNLAWLTIHVPASYGDFFWTFRTPFHAAMTAILFGVIVAILAQRPPFWVHALRQLGRRLIGPIIVAVATLLASRDWFSPAQGLAASYWQETLLVAYVLASLYALLVLLCVADGRLGEGWLGGPALRLVARLSYALYLAHYPVIPLCKVLTARAGAVFGLSHGVQAGLLLVVFLLVSATLAVVMHLLVEKPLLLWRDRDLLNQH